MNEWGSIMVDSTLYDDRAARDNLTKWGTAITRYLMLQIIILLVNIAIDVFYTLQLLEIASFFYFTWIVATIIGFVRLVQMINQLRFVVNQIPDSNLLLIFRLEVVGLVSNFGLYTIFVFMDLTNAEWYVGYLITLPVMILSLVTALFYKKWIHTLTPEIIDLSYRRDMDQGLSLVIVGGLLDFVPNLHPLFNLVMYGALLLYIVGFWKFGQALEREFGVGEFNDQFDEALPEMYTFSHENHLNSEINTLPTLCPYCGAPWLDPDSKTCSTCGKHF